MKPVTYRLFLALSYTKHTDDSGKMESATVYGIKPEKSFTKRPRPLVLSLTLALVLYRVHQGSNREGVEYSDFTIGR